MAFPAMVVASLISAAMLYALTPSILPGGGWDFTTCWLAGVINSATDPVAVVALLKELGASKTLGTLIEGESLLNDGSAVVLYVFVKNLIGYDHKTIPPPWMREDNRQVGVEFVRIVGQMALFGVFLGLAAGWLSRQVRVLRARALYTRTHAYAYAYTRICPGRDRIGAGLGAGRALPPLLLRSFSPQQRARPRLTPNPSRLTRPSLPPRRSRRRRRRSPLWQLLRFVYADKLVETSILVGISYLTFWVGELATGASAVLAVVVLGLYMNYHKSCLSPSVIHFMHEFYEAVAHGLNTLIFAIAGMKMGTILADTSLQSVRLPRLALPALAEHAATVPSLQSSTRPRARSPPASSASPPSSSSPPFPHRAGLAWLAWLAGRHEFCARPRRRLCVPGRPGGRPRPPLPDPSQARHRL